MELTFYGKNCLYIATKALNVLVEPNDRSLKLKKDVILFTTKESEVNDKDSFAISLPGEYEIKNVTIQGAAAQLHSDEATQPKQGLVYAITAAGVKLAILGNIAPELTEEQLDILDSIDVLVLPVGGHGLTLDAHAASKIVGQLEPQYVIPVHYDDGKTTYDVPQDKVEVFLKEMGNEALQPVASLKINPKELGAETTQVVLLETS